MRQFIYIILTALAFCLCLAGCTKQTSTAKSVSSQPPVAYTITAPRAGKIIGLIAEKGERISKGQPLFAMADEALTKQESQITTEITKEEAMLKVMQTGMPNKTNVNLTTLQAQQEAAQKKATKMSDLYAQGAVSRMQAQAAQQELAQAKLALQNAKQQSVATKPATPEAIAAQTEKIKALKLKLEKLHKQLQANEVLCPATVIVKEVYVKNATLVTTEQKILLLEATEK